MCAALVPFDARAIPVFPESGRLLGRHESVGDRGEYEPALEGQPGFEGEGGHHLHDFGHAIGVEIFGPPIANLRTASRAESSRPVYRRGGCPQLHTRDRRRGWTTMLRCTPPAKDRIRRFWIPTAREPNRGSAGCPRSPVPRRVRSRVCRRRENRPRSYDRSCGHREAGEPE